MYYTINLSSKPEIKTMTDTVIALGDFDGVHTAHRRILEAAVQTATAEHAIPCVWMFSSITHKSADGSNNTLTTMNEKISLIKSIGIERAYVADFESFRNMAPDAFITFLKEEFHCVGVTCGYNFSFGQNRSGTPTDLTNAFSCAKIEKELQIDRITVSSTAVRRFLAEGRPDAAAKFLGYPYAVSGTVSHGNGVGHRLGFPTANIVIPKEKMMPKSGVYFTVCTVDSETVFGVTDVGTKPTVVNNGEPICETFLLEWGGNLYGKEIKVSFLQYIRPERQFSTIDELTAQIHSDVDTVSQLSKDRKRYS